MFKAKGECSNCHKKYDLPCKDVKSSSSALKVAGWISGTKGDETRIACPLVQCHNAIEDWGAGVEQDNLPGVNEVIDEVVKRVNEGGLDTENVTVTAEKVQNDGK